MPLPKPNDGESHDDFMSRCMANPTMREEYPEQAQRYAVCQSIWDDKSKGNASVADWVDVVEDFKKAVKILNEQRRR